MTALSTERFAEFFEAVNVDQGQGVEPFPWLVELVAMLADGRLPDVIDVPTGFGKTSVIDCWAYALAIQAAGGQPRLPRRLCFVVDRRLVIDQAHDKARALAERLSSEPSGIVGEVAEALRSLHGGDARPLEVVRMRGGTSWDSRWLARPDQAALVVGTVDQFGSRLLFRGYGASDPMRPIDAALVGVDSWLVIDEAHVAEPLVDTVHRVQAYQQLTELTAERGLRVTAMSATARVDGHRVRPDLDAQATSDRFPRAAAAAARRLAAEKPVTLFELQASSRSWAANARTLGIAMAAVARRLAEGEAPPVVGVVANKIATARAAHAELVAAGEQAILLIGRVREFERGRIQERWIPRISVGASRLGLERPLYVVATQTIEVGANLDLDALVTECAPLPSLAQRFGRVNRVGERVVRPSAIVHMSSLHDDDLVYGPVTGATWEMLARRGGTTSLDPRRLGRGPWPPSLDFGLRSVVDLIHAGADLVPPTPFIPIVLGAHLERWASTSPAPFPDQPVTAFLHGVDRGAPEVEIAWRAKPPERATGPDSWAEWLDLVPPVEWEFVSVPVSQARAFLAGAESDLPTADIEGSLSVEETPKYPTGGRDLLGVVYRGRGASVSAVRGPADVVPGDRVVVRSDLGGHDEWGWTGIRVGPDGPPVPDVADLAPTRRRGVLRLNPEVFRTWLPELAVAAAFAGLDAGDPTSAAATMERLAAAPLPEPLVDLVRQAQGWPARKPTVGEEAWTLQVLLAPPNRGRTIGWASDDDEGSTSQMAHRVTIGEHGEAVGRQARLFAEHLGLPATLARAVELAGRWHDLGKADPRFQLMLHDGDQLEALAAAAPLAKSGRDPRDPVARRAAEVAGLPAGFRHEALSARLFDGLVELEPRLVEGVDPELVRHLIVSHHGKARPLIPALVDDAAPDVAVETDGLHLVASGRRRQVEWEQPRRFEILNERYGWWGVALLETLVRLADMLCSERGR